MLENTEKVQVHMLPTDKINKKGDICMFSYGLNIAAVDDIGYPTQHLYFTSTEEIKEGDNSLQLLFSGKYKLHLNISQETADIINEKQHINFGSKIVATTNSELYKGGVITNKMTDEKSIVIARIPLSFLAPYIESYNAGTPITEVLLETEKKFVFGLSTRYVPHSLKLRADNSVIIYPVKERMYSRAELKVAVLKAVYTDTSNRPYNESEEDEWFEEKYPF